DILFNESSTNTVLWYRNTGDTVFDSGTLITENALTVRDAKAMDMDGDGDMDVVSASQDDNKVAWYENTNSLGSFGSEKRITSIVNFVNHIDTADLDGDGALDLIYSSHADNKLAWYRNTNGQGDFSETQMVVSDQLPGARDAVANDM